MASTPHSPLMQHRLSAPRSLRSSMSQSSLHRPPFSRPALGASPSLLRATKPTGPRSLTSFGGRKNDPLLRASRSAATLPSPSAALAADAGVSQAAARPTTPGGGVRALRSRLETARLTDQNITLAEDVHRLSSQVEAHHRFHSRAGAASEGLEQRCATAEAEVARLRAENDALALKLRSRKDSSGSKEKRLEAMLAVAKQEMAALRQRVNAQEIKLRALDSQQGAMDADGQSDTACADGATNDASSVGDRSVGRPPARPLTASSSARRLSISVGLRSPGSGPLLISPMQSPAVTPRSVSSTGSSPRVGEDERDDASRLYRLQAQVAQYRAEAALAERRAKEAVAERNAVKDKAQAYRKELELKDSQMQTLRERITALETGGATAGGGGAASDDDDDGGFEAVLREEMESMRQSYMKKIATLKAEMEDTTSKHARHVEYWKDQLNDAKQRHLGLQMQYERLQRKQQQSSV